MSLNLYPLPSSTFPLRHTLEVRVHWTLNNCLIRVRRPSSGDRESATVRGTVFWVPELSVAFAPHTAHIDRPAPQPESRTVQGEKKKRFLHWPISKNTCTIYSQQLTKNSLPYLPDFDSDFDCRIPRRGGGSTRRGPTALVAK